MNFGVIDKERRRESRLGETDTNNSTFNRGTAWQDIGGSALRRGPTHPRQEAGRYLDGTVVLPPPQTHLKTALPPPIMVDDISADEVA
jgi:hypothetical protein